MSVARQVSHALPQRAPTRSLWLARRRALARGSRLNENRWIDGTQSFASLPGSLRTSARLVHFGILRM
jgi:hypothetical protein